MTQQQRRRGGALWGALFGAALIVLYIVYRFVLRAVNRRIESHPRGTSLVTSLQFGFFCLVVILLALAGFTAARLARRLEPGIGAGAFAGFLLALVELGVAIIDAYHARRHGQPSFGSPVLTSIRDFITLTLVGIGAGAIGGLLGSGTESEPPALTSSPPVSGNMTPPANPFQSAPPPASDPSQPSRPDDYPTFPPI